MPEASAAAPFQPLPFDAILLVTPQAQLPLAGTTLLTRAAFTAARAGARRVLCVGAAPPSTPRLPPIPVTWAAADDSGAVAAWACDAPAIVVAAATTVVDRDTLAAFASTANGAIAVAPSTLLWRGAASDALVGMTAVAATVKGDRARGMDGARRWSPPPAAVLIDASTDVGRSAATRALFTRIGRRGDSWFTRHVDRRLSRAITRVLLPTGIAPNAITLISIMIGIMAGLLFATGGAVAAVAGAVLFLLSTIVDGCDGEVARLTFRESQFGAWLDVIGDNVVHLVLFAGIAIGLYRHTPNQRFVVLGTLMLTGLLLSMATVWWSLVRRRPTPAQERLFTAFASREFAYVLVALTAAGLLEWFLWCAAIGNWVFSAALLALGRARPR